MKFYSQVMRIRAPKPKPTRKKRQKRLVKDFETKVHNLLKICPLQEGDERQDRSKEDWYFSANLSRLNKKQLRRLMKKIESISSSHFDEPELADRFERLKQHARHYIEPFILEK